MAHPPVSHFRPHPWHGLDVGPDPPQILNAYGHMVPETPENVTKREKEAAALAKQEARDQAAAEKAEKKRLSACAKRGIPDEECAPPETGVGFGPVG